jgi:hypothetical protein
MIRSSRQKSCGPARRHLAAIELSNDVDGHEGLSHLRLWMSSGRCRWALICLAFGTLTSINNFAAVTASKAGKEGTLKKIKKCLTVTRYRTPPAIDRLVARVTSPSTVV